VKIYINYLCLCGQSVFILICFAVCTATTTAQQPTSPNFKKPTWLNCGKKGKKDLIEETILYEYGAIFLSQVFNDHPEIRPSKCYMNEKEVGDYLKKFSAMDNKLEFGAFYLQTDAKKKLLDVFTKQGGYIEVARNFNGTTKNSIRKSTKGDLNDDWAQRDFPDTINNWKCGLKRSEIEKVIKGEDKNCSIYLSAIPGSSQHHFGLAIDVNNGKSNFDIKQCKKYVNCKICDENCEKVLNDYGWFRTVRYDAFHFTYLGWNKDELSRLGLKSVSCKDKNLNREFIYWVPKMKGKNGGCKNV
jgi:hypothetical protein